MKKTRDSESIFFSIPPKSLNFTGREKLLKKIDTELNLSSDEKYKPIIITVLYGLGGIGKTQLAIQYVWEHLNEYNHVFWIAAEAEQLDSSYEGLARKLQLIKDSEKIASLNIREKVISWLENNQNYLMVFDNAIDYQSIEKYLPTLSKSGKILITSRQTAWSDKSISVGLFSREESRNYILKILNQDVNRKDDVNEIDALAKILGFLPLAFAQASAYIQNTHISIKKYLADYQVKYLKYDKLPLPDKHIPVYITWDVTMKTIQDESPLAIKLIQAAAYLYHQKIPLSVLNAYCALEKHTIENCREALSLLEHYSMITFNSVSTSKNAEFDDYISNSISLHNLVQEVIRDKYPKKNILIQLATALNESLPKSNEELVYDRSSQAVAIYRVLKPHFEIIVKRLELNLEKTDEFLAVEAGINNNLGIIIYYHNDISIEDDLEDASDLSLKNDDATTWNIALEYFERSLKIRQTLKNEDLNLAMSYNNVARAKLRLKPDKETIKKEIFEKLHNAKRILEYLINNPLAEKKELINYKKLKALIINNLGVAHKAVCHYKEALEFFEEAKKIRHEIYGNNSHALIALICIYIGTVYLKMREYKKALNSFKEAEIIWATLTGKNFEPDKGLLYYYLGVVYFKLNNVTESELCFQTALKILGEIYSSEVKLVQASVSFLKKLRNNLVILDSLGGKNRQSLSQYAQTTIKAIKLYYLNDDNTKISLLFSKHSFSIQEIFINLAVMEESEHQKREKKFNEEKINREGNLFLYESIFKPENLIPLKDIFESANKLQIFERLFVEGRSGIGKSTLCQYIANQWALPKEKQTGIDWINEYDVVLWLPLRHLLKYDKKDTVTLAQFIRDTCFESDDKNNSSLDNIKQALLENTQLKILFLLDGYDEVTNLSDEEESDRHTILKKLLKQRYIVLTSRPNQFDKGNLKGWRQLENIGFVEDNVTAYIRKFFKLIKHNNIEAQQSSEGLLNFLDKNHNIKCITHIPLNVELLCNIWNNEQLETDLTLTQLYQKIVVYLLKRYLLKLQKNYPLLFFSNETVKVIKGLSDKATLTHHHCQTQLEFISELAWINLQEKSLIISTTKTQLLWNKYVKKISPINIEENRRIGITERFKDSIFKEIGILKPTGGVTHSSLEQNYYFIHLTFQEYFAAYYVADNLKNNNENITRFISSYKYHPSYQNIWWFVAGSLSENFEALEKFFTMLEEEPKEIRMLYHLMLIMKCFDEARMPEITSKNSILVQLNRLYFSFLFNLNQWDKKIEFIIEYLRTNTRKLMNESGIIPALLGFLKIEFSDKKKIIYNLGRLGFNNAEIIDALLDFLQYEEEVNLRAGAILTLYLLNHREIRIIAVLLNGALNDKDKDIRSLSALTLEKLLKENDVDIIDKLVEGLHKETEEEVQCVIAAVLFKFGKKDNEILNKLPMYYKFTYPDIRYLVLTEISALSFKDYRMVSALLGSLGDDDRDVRRIAKKMLAKFNFDELLTALRTFTETNFPKDLPFLNELNKHVLNKDINALLSMTGVPYYLVQMALLQQLHENKQRVNNALFNYLSEQDTEETNIRFVINIIGDLKITDNKIIELLLKRIENTCYANSIIKTFGKLKIKNQKIINALKIQLKINGIFKNWFVLSNLYNTLKKIQVDKNEWVDILDFLLKIEKLNDFMSTVPGIQVLSGIQALDCAAAQKVIPLYSILQEILRQAQEEKLLTLAAYIIEEKNLLVYVKDNVLYFYENNYLESLDISSKLYEPLRKLLQRMTVKLTTPSEVHQAFKKPINSELIVENNTIKNNFPPPIVEKPISNIYYDGKLPDTKEIIHFQKETVLGDGNCGLTALGTDRNKFVKALLSLAKNKTARESLYEEIYQAFIANEVKPYSDEWNKLLKPKNKLQLEWDAIIRDLREKIPATQKFEGHQKTELIKWLAENKNQQIADQLSKKELEIFQAEEALRCYCCSEEVYRYYVNAFASEEKKLWVGHASSLLFARATSITVYIWEEPEKISTPLTLKARHVAPNPKNTIHLFYPKGSIHFDLLCEVQLPQKISNKHETNHMKKIDVNANSNVKSLEHASKQLIINFLELDAEIADIQQIKLQENIKKFFELLKNNSDKINRYLTKQPETVFYKQVPKLIKDDVTRIEEFQKNQSTNASYQDKQILHGICQELLRHYNNLLVTLNPPVQSLISSTQTLYAHLQTVSHLIGDNQPFSKLLAVIKQERENYSPQCRVFICYAMPSDNHKNEEAWIQPFLQGLHDHLKASGIPVILKIDDNFTGNNSHKFIEQIENAHYVMLIGTPSLLEKHRQGTHSICEELNRIKVKREKDVQHELFRVLPILLIGNADIAFPIEFHSYTNIEDWQQKSYLWHLKNLIAQVYDIDADNTTYNQAWETFAEAIKQSYPELVEDVLFRPYEQKEFSKKNQSPQKIFPPLLLEIKEENNVVINTEKKPDADRADKKKLNLEEDKRVDLLKKHAYDNQQKKDDLRLTLSQYLDKENASKYLNQEGGAEFDNITIQDVNIEYAKLDKSNFANAKFLYSQLQNVSFFKTNINGAQFKGNRGLDSKKLAQANFDDIYGFSDSDDEDSHNKGIIEQAKKMQHDFFEASQLKPERGCLSITMIIGHLFSLQLSVAKPIPNYPAKTLKK